MAEANTSRSRLLVLAALAAIMAAIVWVVIASGPGEDPAIGVSPGQDGPGAGEPEAVALAPDALPPLPGEGPITVDLSYRGAEGEERILPKLGGSLEGRITDERDAPIAAARIAILGGPQDGLATRSDEYGRYRFPSLLPGTHLFRIEAGAALAGRQQRILSRAPTRRDFVVGSLVSPVLLVLGSDGEPVEGAEVSVDLLPGAIRTAEDGLAHLANVPRSPRVLVDVRASRHVPVRHELNFIPPMIPSEPVDLPPLPRGGLIRGHVKSWPGGPAPTVTVVPRSDRIGAHKVIWETWQDLAVDWEGRFVLENLPTTQTVDIRVAHPEGVARPPLRAVRANAESTSSVEFVVVRGSGRVSGEVVGPDGRPLAEADVVLEAADPRAVLGALYPGLAEGVVTTRLPVPAALRRAIRSGADGRFDFALGDHPAGSGHLILTARKLGYAPARSVVRNVRGGYRLRLELEDRSGQLRLSVRSGPELPPVRWFLDGKEVAGESAGSLGGLLAGYYELSVRRGETLLYQNDDYLIRGLQELPLR